MSDSALTLRPIRADDEPFLLRVYASTREEELARVPWSVEQRDAFVRTQFAAQHRYYQEHYQGAAFDVILAEGRPVGRLYVARWPQEIRVIDIALLPEHRNAGLGTRLLDHLFAEADAAGKPVSIHVEKYNPAMRLYRRLGFVEALDRGVYLLMRRPAGGPPASRPPASSPPARSALT